MEEPPLSWMEEPPPQLDGGTPPRMENPPREADSGIRSTIGRYASYWNAFLLQKCKKPEQDNYTSGFTNYLQSMHNSIIVELLMKTRKHFSRMRTAHLPIVHVMVAATRCQ